MLSINFVFMSGCQCDGSLQMVNEPNSGSKVSLALNKFV